MRDVRKLVPSVRHLMQQPMRQPSLKELASRVLERQQIAPGPDMQGAMSAAAEAARRDVLARLQAHPEVQRAFVTRFEGGLLIVTLGIRHVGTCELVIPAERFGQNDPADYAALIDTLAGAEIT
jgi:hypothetical protein